MVAISKSKVLKTEPLSVENAQWATLVKTTYTDPNGQTRVWESAQRLTRPANSEIDGVGIAAILEKEDGPHILLQKQWRPPIAKVCIEVPAGLIDEGETAEECALRELKEETGYVGEIVRGGFEMTPLMFNDPGFCNTNLHMVHVNVDMSKPENQDPKPQLEDNEFIDCFTLPLKTMYTEIQRLGNEGYAIDARVGTLAEGIEIAKRWKLCS